MSIADVEAATRLLKNPAENVKAESALLESIVIGFGKQHEFVCTQDYHSLTFRGLFDALIDCRLLSPTWLAHAERDHLLRVLQAVRLFTRDAALRRLLAEKRALEVVAQVLDTYAKEHFSTSTSPFQAEIITECASIIKRLAGEEWGIAALAATGVHTALLQLLGSSDPTVLPLVLVALIGYAAHPQYHSLVARPDSLEQLLRVVQQYELPFKKLAADVLAVLARNQPVVEELLAVNCLGRMVGLLQSGDSKLTQSLLRMLCYMACEPAAAQEMYQVGVVPMLLALIAPAPEPRQLGPYYQQHRLPPRPVAAPGASGPLVGDQLVEAQLVCTALARLAEASDDIAHQIRQCNGVFLVGQLLVLDLAAQGGRGGSAQGEERGGARGIAAHALRTLRYLFSVERNRKLFKRLFPPDLFAQFIDIGHYNSNLQPYVTLVSRFQDLVEKQRAAVAVALEDIDMDREAGHRVVRGYEVLELLGKGAFGAVYKARRPRAEALVALKELPMLEGGLFGANDTEQRAGARRMTREVEILSSLHHPNIVQYYESFVEGQHLYIVMELVEGPSLLDYLSALQERGRWMPEHDIWQVVIAVVLALNYIHGQKRVIHRDLTPGNIVLGQGSEGFRHTKIADFGLAKCLATGSITQSVVGTMPYTCPEIIQQEHYSEKADIWSLGCVIYHMMMMRPPFDGTNPLSVASKIVEGTYDPLQDPPSGPPYSDSLKQLVNVLLTTDPNKRPNSEMVAAGLAPRLMAQLDAMHSAEQVLLKQLHAERRHRRASWDLSTRKIDAYRKLAHMQLGHAPSSAAGSDTASQPASPGMRRNSVTWPDAPPSPTSTATTVSAASGCPPAAGVVPLSALAAGMIPAGGGPGGSSVSGAQGQGGARTVSIAQSRLRPVADPGAQILQQLHKVMWVEQLPPGLTRDPRRRVIELFRRNLFSTHANPGSIKMQLAKLTAGDPEVIRDAHGPVDFGGSSMTGPLGQRDGCLTYQQLQQMLEAVLDEKGFYRAVAG